ncbi:MAG: hypothetical protein KDE51_05895 [Anaerolineales bacterium]|nr:hypothetical protein [Anaerolineales bacterium]
MAELPIIFLKLGGSLITDKSAVEMLRTEILNTIAAEIAAALAENNAIRLVLGHGSGSFGHVAAAKHQTRQGASTPEQWRGFAEVSDAAARLNRHVASALLDAGLPVISISPSASAMCDDGVLQHMEVETIRAALNAGLIPLIYGDVAFDTILGGTIISTEEEMIFLSDHLRPTWLFLAGETDGVYDENGDVIPAITHQNFETVKVAIGGSEGTDVTGGMLSKVEGMLDLVNEHKQLAIKIFSGAQAGNIQQLLTIPETKMGTVIYSPLPTEE